MTNNQLPHTSLEQAMRQCQLERESYTISRDTSAPSPGCLDVFRWAFAGDQDAWVFLIDTFHRVVLSWARSEYHLDRESVINEAWAAFAHYAAKKSDTLLVTNQIGSALKYLQRCVKSAILNVRRKESGDSGYHTIEGQTDDHSERMAITLSVRRCLDEFLEICTPEERLIIELRFEQHVPPREIASQNQEVFRDIVHVRQVIQNVMRRLQKNECLKRLVSDDGDSDQASAISTTLPMTTLNPNDQKGLVMLEPCNLGEEVLLDYILGQASPAVQSQIETLPACTAAAARLATFFNPLMPLLFRMHCPESYTLVEFYEKALPVTTQLIVYNHVRRCPTCQSEIELLSTIDMLEENTAAIAPSLMERLINLFPQRAIFRPAVESHVRGERREYTTEAYTIFLMHRETQSIELLWDLSGTVLYKNQPTNIGHLVQVFEQDAFKPVIYEQKIEAHGRFRFTGLTEGIYTLIVQCDPSQTGGVDIVITDIIINGE